MAGFLRPLSLSPEAFGWRVAEHANGSERRLHEFCQRGGEAPGSH
jgi:hypothetical protein